MSELALQRAKAVRLMIFDVDGILTDGRLYFSAQGEELKAFNILDGHGLKMLRDSGVETAILTARKSAIVERRAQELGIANVRQGVANKLAGFLELLEHCKCTAPEAGYAGDDVVDLPVLTRCGFAASVPNAMAVVKSRAHLVTRANGGHGAAREICEFIMNAQGTLGAAMAPYLE